MYTMSTKTWGYVASRPANVVPGPSGGSEFRDDEPGGVFCTRSGTKTTKLFRQTV